MEIRPATPADAAAITEVVLAAGVAAWSDFLGRERIESANYGRRHPADLVAVDEDGVCAIVAWDEATGEITRLYTHPRAWNRGAATGLLEAAAKALRAIGARQAWLYTEERGKHATAFYESRGWRVEGEPRERDWHGAPLRERRYVKDL